MEATLTLLIDCCRQALDGSPGNLPERLRQADGARLAELARRHELELLLWRSLREFGLVLPGTVALGLEARRAATDSERLAAESARLHRNFAGASLPHLFLGGPALGCLAWKDVALARDRQIRLLVTANGIGKAAALLSALGYVQEEPDPSVDTADWHRGKMRSCWRSDDGLILHLQSRVADHPALLAGLTANSSPLSVVVASAQAIPTFQAGDQLAFLAVEGGSGAWSKLAWLADFAALAGRMAAESLAQAVERAARLGAERPLAAALVLSHRLLGTALPPELWFDGGAARLEKLALAEIQDLRTASERRFGGFRAARSRMLLMPGSRYFFSDALRQIGSALTR